MFFYGTCIYVTDVQMCKMIKPVTCTFLWMWEIIIKWLQFGTFVIYYWLINIREKCIASLSFYVMQIKRHFMCKNGACKIMSINKARFELTDDFSLDCKAEIWDLFSCFMNSTYLTLHLKKRSITEFGKESPVTHNWIPTHCWKPLTNAL